MAFTAAGLGGSFASGIMQGQQSAQQRREGIEREKEKDYLGMYSKLVQSGEWEPVDSTKGVKDGGVLRIGNVGFLQQRKASGPSLKDQKMGWEIENIQSQIGSRGRVAVGTVRERKVPGPKGEILIVPYEWDGEKWNPQGPGVKEKESGSTRDPSVWVDPNDTSKTVQVFPGDRPPVGWQKAAPIGTQKSLEIRENVLRGGGLEDDIRLSLDEFKSNASYLDLKKAAPDGVVGKRQQVAIDAGVRYANASAQKQALAEGMSSGEAKKAGELAGKQRRQELEDRLNKPEVSEEEGYYDRVVRKLEEMFGERRKAKKAATKQTQPPAVRRKIIDDKKLKSLMQGAPSIPIEKFDWK